MKFLHCILYHPTHFHRPIINHSYRPSNFKKNMLRNNWRPSGSKHEASRPGHVERRRSKSPPATNGHVINKKSAPSLRILNVVPSPNLRPSVPSSQATNFLAITAFNPRGGGLHPLLSLHHIPLLRHRSIPNHHCLQQSKHPHPHPHPRRCSSHNLQ
jgi:hypothetical protein